ncbi:hypothetical protein JOM56_013981 [Amanita muscaria]
MEVHPNTASGIPGSPFSSTSSASSSTTPNSGFASTSRLSASTSTTSTASASFAQTSSTSYSATPGSNSAPTHLCSLTAWSQQHIRAIFEADTDDDALLAIKDTFAAKVTASVNGVPLPREGIDALVLSMRSVVVGPSNTSKSEEKSRLQVTWKYCVDVPRDPSTNREGSFGGVYVVKGIKRAVPGSQKPVEFERHKTVTVKIDSMSPDLTVDSRKITNLVFVASDVRVDEPMAPSLGYMRYGAVYNLIMGRPTKRERSLFSLCELNE